MSTDVEFTPLPEGNGSGLALPNLEVDLGRLTDVSVELAVEVGRTHMSLGEAMALGPGSVVTLDRLADKPVDLLINGRSIARGEVVVIDEQFGLRITEVVSTAAPEQVQQSEFVSLDGPQEPPELAIAPEPAADEAMDPDAIAAMFAQGSDEAPADGAAEEPPAAAA
jgi:flagellar motor switch protein FliN/FliY